MKPPTKIQKVSNGYIVTTSIYLSAMGEWHKITSVSTDLKDALTIVRKDFEE